MPFRPDPESSPDPGLRRLRLVFVGWLLPCAFLCGCQFLDTPTVLEDGPYVSVVGGGVAEIFDLDPVTVPPSGPTVSLESESTYTYGVRGGYRFLDHRLAAEVSWEQLGDADLTLKFPRMDVGRVDGSTTMLQIKGYLNDAPLQGYALAGVGVIDADVKDTLGAGISRNATETVYKLGGGIEAHTGRHWTFFVESAWTKPTGDVEDFEYVTVLGGVGYRF